MSGRFDGKVVIVTGAAGGIGSATAERFLQEGARVVAVDLDGPALAQVRDTWTPGETLLVTADVSKTEDTKRFVAESVARFGGVDFLFNNAGVEGNIVPIDEYPDDAFDTVVAVNLRGVFLGIKYAVPELRKRGGGVIVNTASVAGLIGDPMIPAYIATKHAVLGLTKSAAIGFGPENIRVNAVCPSPIETRMMRSLESGMAPGSPHAVKKMMEERIPLGRYGTAEEVAAVVAFLCSEDAAFVNGGIYTVDGGMISR
ncbi:MAG: glucose 1-dehydrogenase [Myxococcota bacterium]|nr:glucose 1-dehydrogenase [Myxococcota bacterium]